MPEMIADAHCYIMQRSENHLQCDRTGECGNRFERTRRRRRMDAPAYGGVVQQNTFGRGGDR